MKNLKSLSIVIPALNEELSLSNTVELLVKALCLNGLDWEIILINDGSRDKTGGICDDLSGKEQKICVIHNSCTKGIGYCFRKGIEHSKKEAITWFPADGENDPEELIKYLALLEHVDLVIPFVLNTGIRSLYRRVLSTAYLWVTNFLFGTTFNYTNGNVIYKRKVFDSIDVESRGYFFQTECLIKAVRAGFMFAEVPVRLRARKKGFSNAVTMYSFGLLVLEFVKLFIKVHITKTTGKVPEDFREHE